MSKQKQKQIDQYRGHYVLVNDHMAGLLAGRLLAIDTSIGAGMLAGARKIHYFTGSADVQGIGARGLDAGSRVTPVTEVNFFYDVEELIICTAEAEASIVGYPEWTDFS